MDRSLCEDQPIAHAFPGKVTMLIVDDLPMVIEVFARRFRQYGQEVLTAISGHQALEIFQQQSVDVVLCDLDMPDTSGWQVGKSIAQVCLERGIPKTPFILVTGAAPDLITESRMQESGVDAVVTKPVDARELLDVIAAVLEEKRPPDGRPAPLTN